MDLNQVKGASNYRRNIPKPKKLFGVRHIQYVVLCLTVIIFTVIFTSLSVVIVPMKNDISSEIKNEGIQWTNPDTVLSAFFWASFIPTLTGTKLSNKYPPKWILLISMLIGAVFNIAIPPMVDVFGSSGAIGCRVVQGLTDGFLHASLYKLIIVWSPSSELNTVRHFILGGVCLGRAICMPLASYFSSFEYGWATAFYVLGVCGIIWSMIFAVLCKHSPAKHKSINDDERMYIEEKTDEEEQAEEEQESLPTPWFKISTSPAVWAILLSGCAHCWGTFTLLTQLPSYMTNMMNLNILENGDMASIPYFTQLLISLVLVPLLEHGLVKLKCSTTVQRRIFNTLGCMLPAISLAILAFLNSSQKGATIALLVLAVSTSTFTQAGYFVNIRDIAPNHFVVLLSIVNFTTNIPSLCGPLVVGLLGNDKKDPILWRYVFLIAASIYLFCGIFYVFFGTAEEEKWNEVDPNEPSLGEKLKKRFGKWFGPCFKCCKPVQKLGQRSTKRIQRFIEEF